MERFVQQDNEGSDRKQNEEERKKGQNNVSITKFPLQGFVLI